MERWNEALREGLVAGTLASILSTAVLAYAGRRETGHAAAPINAVSHWLWHPEALRANEATMRHTGVGLATHQVASVLWATLYAATRESLAPGSPPSVAGAVATSAVAAVVDFKMTPQRFTPGFEHRLSTSALVAVYAALALGTYLGATAWHRWRPHHRHRRFLP